MRTRRWFVTIVLLVTFGQSVLPQSGSDLFQKALVKERTEGKIEEAMEILERVVRENATNRPLAAKALLQLGIYSEKLRKTQARQYYDRLLLEYSDQKAEASQAQLRGKALAAHGTAQELRERKLWTDMNWDRGAIAVSPDGASIAFVELDGSLSIRQLRSPSNRRLVNGDIGRSSSPVFSPDGSSVAYGFRSASEEFAALKVSRLDGTGDRILLAGTSTRYQPRGWAPNGKLLVLLSARDRSSQVASVESTTGAMRVLKSFLGPEEPQNLRLSPDGRLVAYDSPAQRDGSSRTVFVMSALGGFAEEAAVENATNARVLGWPDSRWLLFTAELGAKRGIWATETVQGKPSGGSPIFVKPAEGISSLQGMGTTRSGSIVLSSGRAPEVSIVEGVLSELASLQVASFQQPQAQATASIEGVVLKLGTNEPISGVDVEITRLEGSDSLPLAPGVLEAFTAALRNPPQIVGLQPPAEVLALAPELRLAQTGPDGRFIFRNLKAGGYRIAAARVGGAYNPAEYGQRHPRGRGMLLAITAGQAARNIRLEMAPSASISGRIVDDNGEPVAHASVRAAEIVYVDGERSLRTQQIVLSDDHGDYRFFWLPPGTYYVAAKVEHPDRVSVPVAISSPGASGGLLQMEEMVTRRIAQADGSIRDETYELTYFGGVTDALQAKPIVLRTGGSFAGADITTAGAAVPSHHIRGTLINGVTGMPIAGVQVRALSVESSMDRRISGGSSGSDGSFDLSGIVTGNYLVFTPWVRGPVNAATPAPPPGTIESIGMIAVQAGESDVENVRVVVEPPSPIPGRVMSEGRALAGTDLRRMRIVLTRNPAFGNPPASPPAASARHGVVDDEGSFTLWLPPADYRISVQSLPPNTYIKSIRMGGTNVSDSVLHIDGMAGKSLEITLADAAAQLSGVAVNANLEPQSNVSVVLVPESFALRDRADLYTSVTTDSNGRFVLRSVPPGRYKLFAWEYAEPDGWRNPTFLQPFEPNSQSLDVGQENRTGVRVTVIPSKMEGR